MPESFPELECLDCGWRGIKKECLRILGKLHCPKCESINLVELTGGKSLVPAGASREIPRPIPRWRGNTVPQPA